MAAMAHVPMRVHVEHGWDVGDMDGSNARYNLLRKIYKPFVHEFVATASPNVAGGVVYRTGAIVLSRRRTRSAGHGRGYSSALCAVITLEPNYRCCGCNQQALRFDRGN